MHSKQPAPCANRAHIFPPVYHCPGVSSTSRPRSSTSPNPVSTTPRISCGDRVCNPGVPFTTSQQADLNYSGSNYYFPY